WRSPPTPAARSDDAGDTMNIAVVYNSRRSCVLSQFGQPCPEQYGSATIWLVAGALERAGHRVALVEGDTTLFQKLDAFMPAIDGRPSGLVMNMAYGVQGTGRYTHVPGMLEMAGVPYTGSGPTGHALALDKVVAKDLIRSAGVPTADYAVMRHPGDPC